MPVTVTTREDVEIFPESEKWVIDENELLHVLERGGNVASYNRGAWLHVARSTKP